MKKGQFEAGELIMVIVVVMVLLIIGLVLYSTFQSDDIQREQKESASLDTVQLAREAASMQEISCAATSEPDIQCLDRHRLDRFSQMLNESAPNSDVRNYYRGKFGSALITVEQVYPDEKRWMVYNSSPSEITSADPIRMPVYVNDQSSDTNGFAVMTVVRLS